MTISSQRRRAGARASFVIALGAALLPGLAQAQSQGSSQSAVGYPNKPVTVIVPFAAGGPVDMETRL